MTIDIKIQQDFSTLVYSSNDAASFATAKTTLVDDIQSALEVAPDDESRNGLQLLLSVVDGWTFDPPAPTPAPQPPSLQTMKDLQCAKDFVVTDMNEIFSLIRQASAELRKAMQEDSLAAQSEEIGAAQDQYNTAVAAAQQQFTQAITDAVGQIVGGTISAGFDIGGMAWAAKSAKVFREAQTANESTEAEQQALNTTQDNLDSVGDDQKHARLGVESSQPTTHTDPTKIDDLEQRQDKFMQELDSLDMEASDLRADVTQRKAQLADSRRAESKLDFQREKFTQRASQLGSMGQSMNTIIGGIGRATAAYSQQQADLDRALVDRDSHYLGVIDSIEKAFDQFMSTAQQSMNDAVSQFKDIMNSQAQLSEHLGQNIGA